MIRDELGFGVRKNQAEEQVAEDDTFQHRQGESEMGVAAEKQEAREQFDHQIAR